MQLVECTLSCCLCYGLFQHFCPSQWLVQVGGLRRKERKVILFWISGRQIREKKIFFFLMLFCYHQGYIIPILMLFHVLVLMVIDRSESPLKCHIQFYASHRGFLNYLERRTPVNNNNEWLILRLQNLNLLFTSSQEIHARVETRTYLGLCLLSR